MLYSKIYKLQLEVASDRNIFLDNFCRWKLLYDWGRDAVLKTMSNFIAYQKVEAHEVSS